MRRSTATPVISLGILFAMAMEPEYFDETASAAHDAQASNGSKHRPGST